MSSNNDNEPIKSTLNNGGVMQRSFLLAEMRKIKQTYKERGEYCYELYTLMYGIALKENIPYGMDIHSELMNIC